MHLKSSKVFPLDLPMNHDQSIQLAPVLPQGEEFYDALMAQIEPDLVSTQLPLLEARYAGETPEQKEARQARYDAAFEEFDRRSAVEMSKLEQDVHAYKVTTMREAEAASRQEEVADMSFLESSILAA